MADVPAARAALERADRIVALTGAGISADSGVPTFRGRAGLWRQWRPEDLATPEAFRRDPRLVWEWYAWRRDRIAACRANAGHLALAALALTRPGVTIVTQNVDGLHAEAARLEAERRGLASDPALPLELHGSLFRFRCSPCGARTPHRDAVDASSVETLPRCDSCGGLLRPDVVWFGEPLPADLLAQALEAAAQADACVVVGTSAVVYPAAGVALRALEAGAALIEVNPEATALTPYSTVSVRGRAGEVLPVLLGIREG